MSLVPSFIDALPPENIVVLVSGGVDSLLCADEFPLARRVFVDFDQREADEEKQACYGLFGADGFLRVMINGMHQRTTDGVYVPARNLMLATIALQFAKGPDSAIILGGMADDVASDKTPDALDRMSDILSRHTAGRVMVWSPFFDRCKHEAVAEYVKEDPGRIPRLMQTWSCYSPATTLAEIFQMKGRHACGECKACFRWFCALRTNGVPVSFVPDEKLCINYLYRLHTYHPRRQSNVLAALDGVHQRRVLCVDIDGTLTFENAGHDYSARTPRLDEIDRLNKLATTHWIVLHSSRREMDRAETMEWMYDNGVTFHALLLDKPRAHRYVDERAVQGVSLV